MDIGSCSIRQHGSGLHFELPRILVISLLVIDRLEQNTEPGLQPCTIQSPMNDLQLQSIKRVAIPGDGYCILHGLSGSILSYLKL